MMEEKRVVGKPFQKGPDKRRNTKGRPKSFDKLRELAKQIAIEEVELKDKDGHTTGDTITVIEAILRGWAKDKKYQEKFVEYAYGKVPNQTELTGKDGKPIETNSTVTLADWRKQAETRVKQAESRLDEVE